MSRLSQRRTRLSRWIANRLPKRVIYWAVVRATVDYTRRVTNDTRVADVLTYWRSTIK